MLLDRVERLCENKAELARELLVTPHHVHNWLKARRYEPGGEVTLHLLEWATAEEAKQNKAAGDATNITSDKARITKSSYEKSKADPPHKYRRGK